MIVVKATRKGRGESYHAMRSSSESERKDRTLVEGGALSGDLEALTGNSGGD